MSCDEYFSFTVAQMLMCYLSSHSTTLTIYYRELTIELTSYTAYDW